MGHQFHFVRIVGGDCRRAIRLGDLREAEETNMRHTRGLKLPGIAILTTSLALVEHSKIARLTKVLLGTIVFQSGGNLEDGSAINGDN